MHNSDSEELPEEQTSQIDMQEFE